MEYGRVVAMSQAHEVQQSLEEVQSLLAHLETASWVEEDWGILQRVLRSYARLLGTLFEAQMTLKRLQTLLFGTRRRRRHPSAPGASEDVVGRGEDAGVGAGGVAAGANVGVGVVAGAHVGGVVTGGKVGWGKFGNVCGKKGVEEPPMNGDGVATNVGWGNVVPPGGGAVPPEVAGSDSTMNVDAWPVFPLLSTTERVGIGVPACS